MLVEQPWYKHNWLSQHVLVQMEKTKSSRIFGESSGGTDGFSSCGQVYPTHDNVPAAFIYTLNASVHLYDPHTSAAPAVSALYNFSRGLIIMLILH